MKHIILKHLSVIEMKTITQYSTGNYLYSVDEYIYTTCFLGTAYKAFWDIQIFNYAIVCYPSQNDLDFIWKLSQKYSVRV